MENHEKKYFLDDPRNVQRLLYVFYFISALSIFAEFFIKRYVDHPWEALFGFYGIYGFAACIIFVLIATQLRKLVMRKEDYYDN